MESRSSISFKQEPIKLKIEKELGQKDSYYGLFDDLAVHNDKERVHGMMEYDMSSLKENILKR